MNFIRKIINSDKLSDIINIPQELQHQNVEILILPLGKDSKKDKKNFKSQKFEGLIKLKDIEKKISSLRDEWDRI